MSSAPSVSDILWEYESKRIPTENVVAAVAAEYYRTSGKLRETIKPLMEIIERAHPGVVELAATTQKPGFQVKLAERPFPKRYEDELRGAVREALLVLRPQQIKRISDPGPTESLWRRLVRAVRRVFSA